LLGEIVRLGTPRALLEDTFLAHSRAEAVSELIDLIGDESIFNRFGSYDF
jgi:hypothetical protein